MKKSEIYILLKKYKLLILALLLLFVSVILIQINYNKNHMHNFTVDEAFTISSIHPKLTPDKIRHRALNGPRMFTYLFYPGAMVGMIGHMGGNIYEDGWKYPGHNYFVKNYKTSSHGLKENMQDPNFRYFHYYLKLQAIVFLFLSLIPIVFLLWSHKYYVGMFMVSTLVGINFLALEERSLFYIEPLLLSMMNILTWFYFYLFEKKKISWFWLTLASFLFALTISLKFSALFMIVLVGILLVFKFKTLEKRLIACFSLIFISLIFFCLINWNIFYSKEVFNAAVHDYFSNFYQYATGNKGQVVNNFQLFNLKRMVGEIFSSLGGLIFLFPVILFYGLKLVPKRDMVKWGGFIFVVLLSIGLIAKQRVYIGRNILPFLTALILITGVMLDQIVNYAKKNRFNKKRSPAYLYVIIALLIFVPIWGNSKNYFKIVFSSAKNNIEKAINDIPSKETRRLVVIDYPKAHSFVGFASEKILPSAIQTNGNNFKNFIKNSIASFQTEDVVIVSEINNNKQLTNYVLPSVFNSNVQFGKYFIFYNDISLDKQFQELSTHFSSNDTQSLLKDSVVVREDLILKEVKIGRGNKLFLKFEFLAANNTDWIGCRFFFHGRPYDKDAGKLPEDRVQYGFEGWDFTVNKNNTFRFGNEMYLVQEFQPSLKKYKELTLGIFRGCTKSEKIVVKDVTLL